MLPTLSSLSVRYVPERRLRHRPSSRSLRISPLHREFRAPLPSSSRAVPSALSGLGPEISRRAYPTAYAPCTPSKSEQRLPPSYYRGCWHEVSRGCFCRYRPNGYPFHLPCRKGVYNPKTFIPHAASLRQAVAHCAIFLTAASCRSLARVAVPVWLIVLSDQLPVEALVSHYLTNKLIGHEPIHERDTHGIAFPLDPQTKSRMRY